MKNELLMQDLENEIEHLRVERENLISAFNDLKEGYEKLERENKIRRAYLQLIADKLFDLDGWRDVEGLTVLIEEAEYYAKLGIRADDSKQIYIDGYGKSINILGEELNETTM